MRGRGLQEAWVLIWAEERAGQKRVCGKLAAGAFNLSGMWLEVTTCTENRMGYYYSAAPPREGWAKLALSGTSILTADTHYYRVCYPLTGSSAAWFEVPVLTSTLTEAASAISRVSLAKPATEDDTLATA